MLEKKYDHKLVEEGKYKKNLRKNTGSRIRSGRTWTVF